MEKTCQNLKSVKIIYIYDEFSILVGQEFTSVSCYLCSIEFNHPFVIIVFTHGHLN